MRVNAITRGPQSRNCVRRTVQAREMNAQLQAIVTVLSLVNPVVCGAMFARIEAGRSATEQRADAMKVALTIMVILVVAALIGVQLLQLFGVSLDAFMVAGGGVLAWMGFSMLSGQASSSLASSDTASARGTSLTPLILFAASPGTITGVITLSAVHTRLGFPVTALVAVAVASGVTWLSMLLVARVAHQKSGGGLARDSITRFMGLIILSMGVQFALTGLRQFTH
jgi:multiple antibiotic resistance protein